MNEITNPNETFEESVTPTAQETPTKDTVIDIDIDSPTLCAVIPLMLCKVPLNPNLIDWEGIDLEILTQIFESMVSLRYTLITTKDPITLQKVQQSIDEECEKRMEMFGFDIDYDGDIKEINKDSTRNLPSESRQFLLVNDTIAIYDWIIKNLKIYRELRSDHNADEAYRRLRSIMFNGEIHDESKFNESNDNSWSPDPTVFENEDVSLDDSISESIREDIISDNNNYINNPENLSDDELRNIINSFNDEHNASGLIDDWNTRGV
jgi:hypothetical protein